jgi:hypothetical protein
MAADLRLRTHFFNLPDPRRAGRSPYRLPDLVFITIAATVAGAQDFGQVEVFARKRRDWLARFCQLPQDEEGRPLTPCQDTFERLFKRLNPRHFAGRATPQTLAERILLELVSSGNTRLPRSRHYLEEQLGENVAAKQSVKRIVDHLIGERVLLVRSDPHQPADARVELAHDVLLRRWPRLRDLLLENPESRRIREDVGDEARESRSGGC